MSDTRERRGHCLCGAVRLIVKKAGSKVGACHCSMCRRWSGGPLMEIDGGNDVAFEGQEDITIFDSSPWAERGFCRKCGTNLFYRLKETGQHMILAGLLDDTDGLVFDSQVFIDEKPAYYCFANETKDMTGAEIFAMYGPSE